MMVNSRTEIKINGLSLGDLIDKLVRERLDIILKENKILIEENEVMSENRFHFKNNRVYDDQFQTYLYGFDIVRLLNDLNNENISLKRQRDYWKAKHDEGAET